MIEDVANMIKSQLDASLRSEFDRLHDHKYSYTLQVCRATLARNIDEAFDAYCSGLSRRDVKDLRKEVAVKFGGDYDAMIKQCAETGVKQVMLHRDTVKKTWQGIFNTKGWTLLDKDFHQKSNAVHIDLSKGYVLASGSTMKNDKIVEFNLVNTATTSLYKRARGAAFREMATHIYDARGGVKNAHGKTMRQSAKKFKTVKGHGKALERFGELRPRGDDQTTVAILTLVKKFKTVASCTPNKKYSGKAGDMVRAARRAIMNHLEVNFNLKQYRNVSNTAFDENLVIDLHATDAKGNSEFSKGKYDAPGIKKSVDKYVQKKLIPAMTKGLTKNSKEWVEMKGSTPRKTLVEKQMQKDLIEKLLGIKGSRPDFRLKVNKRLLKMAKDANIKGKTSRTKSLKDRSKASQMKIIGAKAASSYKAKAGTTRANENSKTAESPIALRNILNEYLPQTVAKNMGSPALNFRTGRFANSARVENLAIGPRGGLHIDYTYMREPYETFEPGGKQGSSQRDPKKLIGGSIRELALGILGRQPTTLRRT